MLSEVNFLSIVISRYLMLSTCPRGLLFRYILTSVLSLFFLLVTSMTFDFCSFNVILFFFFAQFVSLPISILAKFSASWTFSALTAINRSSANATALVRFP